MRSALGGAACVCLLAVFATTALGATYNVNTTSDAAGTCGPAPVSCMLRQAIDTINATPNAPDVIDVQAGHYILTLGDLQISSSMTISGAGEGSEPRPRRSTRTARAGCSPWTTPPSHRSPWRG
jgi:hypothetical protein